MGHLLKFLEKYVSVQRSGPLKTSQELTLIHKAWHHTTPHAPVGHESETVLRPCTGSV